MLAPYNTIGKGGVSGSAAPERGAMAEGTDKRGRLDEEPFAYRTTKDGQLFISWQGRQVVTLKGPDARRFLARIAALDAAGVQLALAKVTGNFKHGNER